MGKPRENIPNITIFLNYCFLLESFAQLCYNNCMGIVTGIKMQKSNKNRVSVYVDGKFVTGMQSITVVREGLAVGSVIDESELMRMAEISENAEAFDKALSYLSKGMKTRREVEDNLRKKQFSEGVINAVVDKLVGYGYLGDESYVDSYISCYGRERGENRIRAELLSKGVDKNIIEEKLSALTGQEEAAAKAAEKYVRTHKDADKNKLRRYLYSKGFTYSVISAVTGDDYD